GGGGGARLEAGEPRAAAGLGAPGVPAREGGTPCAPSARGGGRGCPEAAGTVRDPRCGQPPEEPRPHRGHPATLGGDTRTGRSSPAPPCAAAGLGQPPAESHLAAPPRSKRCSCNSWLDKECIYFCHLDIIWVNTPGHTAPYGLGSPPRRRKRSAGRCECSHSRDSICATFCQGRPGYLQSLKLPVSSGASARSLQNGATRPPHHGLLRALR
uniref:Endothelin 2 n=1 Tax=Ficedula albicollis TaxID=59894 RepID=A0A803WDI3_FICAL